MAKRGIVLMNLGSPNSTNVSDVRLYLNEFLMDERVIDVPYLIRLLLVRGIIAPFRAPKSAKAYRSIWTKDGSPLIVLTKALQEALQHKTTDPIAIAMRYGNPSPGVAFDELRAANPDLQEVVLVPLYPHYAMSSYETAVEYAKHIHQKGGYTFNLQVVQPYYRHNAYLEALEYSMVPYLEQHYDHLLFSYHGVPERHIRKGDVTGSHCLSTAGCCDIPSAAHAKCYRHQCMTTTAMVAARLGIPKHKFSVSFQSRLGRDPWLQPYTAKRLEQMPGEGINKLLVVCPAFVSDCLETLEEIAEEGKEIFMHAGGESFTMIPCLNAHPLWINAITQLVEEV